MKNNTHLHEYCISYTCDIPYDLTGHAFNLNKQKRILTTLLTAQAACEPHQQQQYQKKNANENIQATDSSSLVQSQNNKKRNERNERKNEKGEHSRTLGIENHSRK